MLCLSRRIRRRRTGYDPRGRKEENFEGRWRGGRGGRKAVYVYIISKTEMLEGIQLEAGSLAMDGGAHTAALQIIST